jgi:hypothetical protein
MALPRVIINLENGALSSVNAQDDAVCGLVASGVAVVSGDDTLFSLSTAYLLTKLSDLDALGITSEDDDANATIYKAVDEFYSEAPEGTKLWLLAAAASVSAEDLMDVDEANYAKKLIEAANGEIKFLMLAKADPALYEPTIADGLDADTYAAAAKAQELAEWATTNKFAPLFVILEGRHYTGVASALDDLTEGAYDRVCILIGDTISGSTGAAVGLLAGRLASIPVQRSISRVKSGALPPTTMYIASVAAENGSPDIISDAGFISFRTFVGKTGYYFTDDKLATEPTGDYALIPRRRTIDKAYRIAYMTLVNELGDEVPINESGQIPHAIAKSIQNSVETAIENDMTANGNLGTDPDNPNDTGVECFIDHSQNIVSTSKLVVKIRVRPYAYAKYIDVYLGFKTTNV